MILPAYFEEHLVGEIHEDAAGPRFVYAVSWTNDRHAFPISTTMRSTSMTWNPPVS